MKVKKELYSLLLAILVKLNLTVESYLMANKLRLCTTHAHRTSMRIKESSDAKTNDEILKICNSMMARIEKLEKSNEHSARVIERLEEENAKNKPTLQKSAADFELAARSCYVDRTWGVLESSTYLCQTLQQLAEICLPRGICESRPDIIVGIRAGQLATEARQGLPLLRAWLQVAESKLTAISKRELTLSDDEEETLRRKVCLLKEEFETYDAKIMNFKSDDAIVPYLPNSRLGFFAYTSLLVSDDSGFVEELEFDFKQLPSKKGRFIYLQVGEVKSSRSYEAAVQDMLKRMGVLSMAAAQCLKTIEFHPQPLKHILVGLGDIITAFDWLEPDDNMILKKKQEAGIKEYPTYIFIYVTKLPLNE